MLLFLSGMLRKLDIKNEDDVKSLSRVMVHVFSDGVTNWGRIVTLISFGAFVAKHLKSINQESCIEPLASNITVSNRKRYLDSHLTSRSVHIFLPSLVCSLKSGSCLGMRDNSGM